MSPDALENAIHIATQVAMLAGAVTAAVIPWLPLLLPVVLGWIKDEKQRQAFDAVYRAGLIAASAASTEFRKLAQEAAAPGGPGGVKVTDEEKRVILAKATAAGMDALRRSGAMPRTVAAYGSAEAIQGSVESIVHKKVLGWPHV